MSVVGAIVVFPTMAVFAFIVGIFGLIFLLIFSILAFVFGLVILVTWPVWFLLLGLGIVFF